jgi:hypothetical protein
MGRTISSGAMALLLMLGCLPGAAEMLLPQRNRMMGVRLYAAPNGNDTNNSFLDPTAPCTPNGAYIQAMVNHDLITPVGGCRINLAPGTYTVPAGGFLINAAGAYVGGYSCEVTGPILENGDCPNDQAVIVDVPNGGTAFMSQDGVIGIFGCLSVRGGAGSVGFNGRQTPVIDILTVSCGPIDICFSMTQPGMMNIDGLITLRGDMTEFVAASLGAFVKFWNAQISAPEPVRVRYLALSYDGAHVEFLPPRKTNGDADPNSMIVNGENVAGAECRTEFAGRIKANSVPLPCAVIPSMTDGKYYP